MTTNMSEEALIALRGLALGYGGRAILPPLDAEIRAGETWALVGRNGSGKTTLLRTLLGLLPRVGGRVERHPGLCVTYVPQRGDYDLTVPARVHDFVRAGLDRGWTFLRPGRVWRHRAAIDAAMAETDVARIAGARFAELSEGQKQRVLIARALVSDPQVLVLDEPTSAMDPVAERAVFELLDRLRRARGLALVMASHQMSFLPAFATHAIFVDRDHGVVRAGTAAEVASDEHFRSHYGDMTHA
jgi:zinc transport system ATP-binding protein